MRVFVRSVMNLTMICAIIIKSNEVMSSSALIGISHKIALPFGQLLVYLTNKRAMGQKAYKRYFELLVIRKHLSGSA